MYESGTKKRTENMEESRSREKEKDEGQNRGPV